MLRYNFFLCNSNNWANVVRTQRTWVLQSHVRYAFGTCSCWSAQLLYETEVKYAYFRGVKLGYKIPDDFEFLCCSKCGAEWMDSSQTDELSEILEKQRKTK